MRLLTYNILEGARDKWPLLKKFIDEQQPDILVFNEANFTDHFHYDVPEYPYMVWHGYGQGWGNLIASKFPIVKHFMHNIYHRQPNDRGMLSVTLDVHGSRVDVGTYHPHPWRRPHLRCQDYQKLLKNMTSPYRILTGDSNALHDYPHDISYLIQQFGDFMTLERAQQAVPLFEDSGHMMRELLGEHGWIDLAINSGPTIPTGLIRTNNSDMRIDIVYGYHMTGLTTVVRNEMTDAISDHYPLITELDFAL